MMKWRNDDEMSFFISGNQFFDAYNFPLDQPPKQEDVKWYFQRNRDGDGFV